MAKSSKSSKSKSKSSSKASSKSKASKPTPSSAIQKFLDAGVQFTDMSRQQAESVVKSMVKEGEVRRKDAEQLVKKLVERGKETTERINSMIEAEVGNQIAAAKANYEELESRIESLAKQVREATSQKPAPAADEAPTPAKKAPAKKQAAAKKAPAKKQAAAKQAPAKKQAAAKKAPAKKRAATKRAPAKKAVGSSGVRKVSTTRKR